MTERDEGQMLRQLARAVSAVSTDGPLSLRMCLACSSIMSVDGGALTLAYDQSARTTLCVTDERASRLEDLQEVIGEGPSFAAFREGSVVIEPVGGTQSTRWPVFAEAAREAMGGPCTIFAVPISPGRRVMGVATFFRDSEDQSLPMTPEAVRLLINAVGVALIKDPDVIEEDSHTRTQSWAERARIHQAVGMVMAQLRIRTDDAMALMRAHAYAHGDSLSHVGTLITQRRLDFTLTDQAPPGRDHPDDAR